MAELKQKQSKNAPVQAAAPPVQIASAAPQEDRSAISAAQLDAQRRDNLTARQQPQETTSSAAASSPVQTQQASLPQTQAAAPAVVQPQVAAVREGDVVDVAALDTLPRPLRPIRPSYPPIAAQQRISATIILTAFITESGEVADVKVLRGDPRFGLNDAAIRAIRATRFSSPMKDGKRVRTWFPQTIDFRP
jgi:TonB family protein